MNAIEKAAYALVTGIQENMNRERERYREQNEAEAIYRRAEADYRQKKTELRDMCKLLDQAAVRLGSSTELGVTETQIRTVRERCAKEADEERRRPKPVAVPERDEEAFAEELHDRQTAGRSAVKR